MENRTVAIFDFDGTITKSDSYIAFIQFVLKSHPLKLLKLPLLAVYYFAYLIKIQNNDWLKARFLSTLIGDSDKTETNILCDQFLQVWLNKSLRTDAIAAIKEHRKNGDLLVLLSASLDIYINKAGAILGFDHILATKTEWNGNKLTGQLDGNNLKGNNKVEAVLSSGLVSDSSKTISYADDLSDLALLRWSSQGFWVNGSAKLASIAANESNIDILVWS